MKLRKKGRWIVGMLKKSREELGQKEFTETKIKSSILGVSVVITETIISKLIGVKDSGQE